jgi:ribonucleoside-diphosphate reductase alpha chain
LVPLNQDSTILGDFAYRIFQQKYAFFPGETWEQAARRVAGHVLKSVGLCESSDEVHETARLIAARKFIPGGRYLYATGRDLHQVNNCLLMRCEDSREGWAELFWKAGMALMTGAGIGVNYSRVRPAGSAVRRTGGQASGPLSPMRIVNELGRDVMQGGSRRSAIWAGLAWDHPDILDFIQAKDWPRWLRDVKEEDFTVAAPLELTNISVCLDDQFFKAYAAGDARAHEVYSTAMARMLKTGEPGFSIDVGPNAGEDLRNACTEVTSADDSDVCNLGSLNLGRIESLDELKTAVELSTLFLLAGTVYSHVPYDRVAEIREQNRRLGLGLMGVHEWLLHRGLPYGPDPELGLWLAEYANSTLTARGRADDLGLSWPVKTRAIAPNGTIGIIGETTTSIEPIFCAAYKRTYLKQQSWTTEHVIDPVAERLVLEGVDPDGIEDAYSLARDPERRVAFQAWVQEYVDHGISSTVNLPAPVTDPDGVTAFSDTIMPYLPRLRGLTVYPNGARAGQPIVAVPYREAWEAKAAVEGNEAACGGGICSI